MAIQNNGVCRKIYEDSDADLQIKGFFDELAVTLLNNVSVKYLDDMVDTESLTKANFGRYFKGSEMVVAGKLTDNETSTVDIEILINSVDKNLVLSVDKNSNFIDVSKVESLMGLTDFQEITEKTWAYLTIKQLLNAAEGENNETAVEGMKSRAKQLALKYGFVTPLTSMVVTKPETDPAEWRPPSLSRTPRPTTTRTPRPTTTRTPRPTTTRTPRPTTTRTPRPTTTRTPRSTTTRTPRPTTTRTPRPTITRRPYRRYSGGGGYGGGGGGDPHYMIRIKNIEHPICFDVQSQDGEIHNLLTDPRKKITINTQIISGKQDEDGNAFTSFIGKVSIQMSSHVIVITPEAIIFDTKVHRWEEENVKHFSGHELFLSEEGRLLTVRFKFGAELLIKRHVRDGHAHYLNIYVKHEDVFSKKTTGLIGQFVNGFKHIYLRKQFINKAGSQVAKLQIKEGANFPSEENDVTGHERQQLRRTVHANLVPRADIIEEGTEKCWMVYKRLTEDFIGGRTAYLRNKLIDM